LGGPAHWDILEVQPTTGYVCNELNTSKYPSLIDFSNWLLSLHRLIVLRESARRETELMYLYVRVATLQWDVGGESSHNKSFALFHSI
jgi:hypothetical protein